MADHADDGGDNDVFVYMGGSYLSVPQHLRETITHVRIHKSVKIITRRAFMFCRNLVSIEMHDGVEIIEEEAFQDCRSLKRIKLSGVRVVGDFAFNCCYALTDVEFGETLDTIGDCAFGWTSLRNIKIPRVRVIGGGAFQNCERLTEVELSEDLQTTGYSAFRKCPRLRRIAIPLKDEEMIGDNVFMKCKNLTQVDLVGGIHKTISSLFLESWRNEMNNEIDRINHILPNTCSFDKTTIIREWIGRVLQRITHYKSEHYTLLKKNMTQLELALWKIKLDEEFVEALSKEDNESNTAKKAKIDTKAARQEKRITSGANIVIKNVLPFLKLE